MTKTYVPKTLRGVQCPGHIRVNISQLKKWFAQGNSFKGFLVGNNVNSFHFFGGWHLAYTLEAANLEEFTKQLNSFHFYLDPELGNQAAIFLAK